MKIGKFLPSAVLVGVAMMFSGLGHWVEARWVQEMTCQDEREKDGTNNQINSRERMVQMKWRSRRRPVLPPVFTVIATHAMGLLSFHFICSPVFLENQFVRDPSTILSPGSHVVCLNRLHH